MLGLRRQAPPPDEIAASIDVAIAQARAPGTGLVGDISNSLATVDPLRRSHLRGVVFHELLRLRASDADDVLEQALLALERAGASRPGGREPRAARAVFGVAAALPGHPRRARAHAVPADVRAPGRVARGSRASRDRDTGRGASCWRTSARGIRRGSPQAVGRSSTSASDEAARAADARGAWHAVHRGRSARLAAIGAMLVTCPRSNEHVGVGAPPVERFYRAGVRVAIGTDSLASMDDLNLFSELAALRRWRRRCPRPSLLCSATVQRRPGAGIRGRFRHDRAGPQSVAHRDRPAPRSS